MNAIRTAAVEIGLNAAIVSVSGYSQPQILIVRRSDAGSDATGARRSRACPSGLSRRWPIAPWRSGLRAWVTEQTGLDLGYVEQLYTFGDRGRHAEPQDTGLHVVSIGYLALTHADGSAGLAGGSWRSWYDFFPWEDWRDGKPPILSREIEPRLAEWARRPARKGAPVRPLTRGEAAAGLLCRRRRPGRREGSGAL